MKKPAVVLCAILSHLALLGIAGATIAIDSEENSCGYPHSKSIGATGIARFVFLGDSSPEGVSGITDFTFDEITTPNLHYPFPQLPVPEPELPSSPLPAEGPEPPAFPLFGFGLAGLGGLA